MSSPTSILRRIGAAPADRAGCAGPACPDVLQLANGDFLVIGLRDTAATDPRRAAELTTLGAAIDPDTEAAVIVPAEVLRAAAQQLVTSEGGHTQLTIVRAVQTCSACPSQWNAWTAYGSYLYLRYRNGIGTVDSYNDPDPKTWTRPPNGRVVRFGAPSLDGVISLRDFCDAAGLFLAETADVS